MTLKDLGVDRDPSRPWSDFHELAFQVLQRAILDILPYPTEGRGSKPSKSRLDKRRDAWRWLTSNEERWPLSSERVCQLLGVERAYLIRRLAPRRGKL